MPARRSSRARKQPEREVKPPVPPVPDPALPDQRGVRLKGETVSGFGMQRPGGAVSGHTYRITDEHARRQGDVAAMKQQARDAEDAQRVAVFTRDLSKAEWL